MKYCSDCKGEIAYKQIASENLHRHICLDCGRVYYQNPLVVCAMIIEHPKGIVLCKRGIEPKYGLWTIAGGYLERNETVKEGAIRETFEETQIALQNATLFGIYDILHAHQVYLVYKATIEHTDFGPTPESLEVKIFAKDQIPWQQIAFKIVTVALTDYLADPNQIYTQSITK